MTNIPKVGLNPSTRFNTPAGVYAYPLTQEYYEKLVDDELPFQSTAPYCNIMKLNLNTKWLVTGSRFGRATYEDVKAAAAVVGLDVAHDASTHGRHWSMNNDAKIFDLTFFATKNEPRSTVAWTQLLRKLGWEGVYDSGESVIHESEPTQLVCLSPLAYQWIATYDTWEIRKTIDPRQTAAIATARKADKAGRSTKRITLDDIDWDAVNDKRNRDNSLAVSKVFDFLGQRSVTTQELEQLFDKIEDPSDPTNNATIMKDLAINKKSSTELLRKIYNSFDTKKSRAIGAILANPNCPPEIFDDPKVDLEDFTYDLRNNPHTPYEVLARFFDDDELASHRNTPPEVLSKMFDKYAKDMNMRMRRYLSQEERQVLRRVLMNPNAPLDVLKKAIADPDGPLSLYIYVAKNPNLPDEIYRELVDMVKDPDTGNTIRTDILDNLPIKQQDAADVLKILKRQVDIRLMLRLAKFDPKTLDVLSKKFHDNSIITAIIDNPNTSTKTLFRLTQHPSRSVSNKAKVALDTEK